MIRRRTRSRRTGALAALAAIAALLAGCAIPLPEVTADEPPQDPQPALDEPRLDRVLDAIAEALAAGDEAQDAELLWPRVNGPAVETRDAEYRMAEATADTDNATSPQVLTTEPQIVAMSNSDTWPKTILVFTTIPDGQNTPLLLGIEQDQPRRPYHLFAWARLLPGVTTPELAVPAQGSPDVAPDSEDLLLSPDAALSAYADLLQEDEDSDFVDSFAADDQFLANVVEYREASEEGVSEAGSYTETFDVRDFTPVSLQTADGGAIVFGALRSDQTYELTEEGGELTVSEPRIVALAGAEESIEVETSLTATYYITVALYVPPASSDGTIQVLGAERVLDAVDTDDTEE